MPRSILFLGYDTLQTRLIDALRQAGHEVSHTSDPVVDLSAWDRVISFGYRHILKAHILATARHPVLNLHISYLPWNRGAHPLFWSAFDGTPCGFTIHEVDSGIDTGAICYQRQLPINQDTETFASGYQMLIDAIESLFCKHMGELISGEYQTSPQQGAGTFRHARELPKGFQWGDLIGPTVRSLKATVAAQPTQKP